MSSEPTLKLPLRYDGYAIRDADGKIVVKPRHSDFDHEDREKRLNALVLAANSFDRLRAACERLADALEESHQPEIDNQHGGDDPESCDYCKAIAEARAFISASRPERENG